MIIKKPYTLEPEVDWSRPYADAKFMGKPSGIILVNEYEVASTVQCKHCGGHFVHRRNTGIQRGWCFNCAGSTCGQGKCRECMHFKKKIGLYEKGKLAVLR